jgi:uncharacterized protein (TIGR03435 family)
MPPDLHLLTKQKMALIVLVSMRYALALVMLLSFPLPAQTASKSFDAVSIRQSDPNAQGGGVDVVGSRFLARNVTLRALIAVGFTRSNSENVVIDGPAWLDSSRYDIQARVDDATAQSIHPLTYLQRFHALQPLIQAMLVDRFHVQVKTEMRSVSGFEVVVAKGGPKLQSAQKNTGYRGIYLVAHGDAPTERECRAIREDMDNFADVLSHTAEAHGKPVVNHTGLGGKYDFRLTYTPERAPDVSAEPSAPNSLDLSLYEALKSQLGLKMQPAKVSVPFIVVDAAEYPSPN